MKNLAPRNVSWLLYILSRNGNLWLPWKNLAPRNVSWLLYILSRKGNLWPPWKNFIPILGQQEIIKSTKNLQQDAIKIYDIVIQRDDDGRQFWLRCSSSDTFTVTFTPQTNGSKHRSTTNFYVRYANILQYNNISIAYNGRIFLFC